MPSIRAATLCVLIAILLAVPRASGGDSSLDAQRDAALARIQACLQSNNVASRRCKHMNKDSQTLMDVYHHGDKTVLPTLLRLGYLGDFFREAFLSDPDGFLTTVSQLPEPAQPQAVRSIDDARFGLSRPQFDEIRAALTAIPPSSPNYKIAQRFLRTVETGNASFLVNFFPPSTFRDDFKVHWFTNEFYALGQKPLWPPPADGTPIYRVTVLPARSAPESVTLTISPDGSGETRFCVTDIDRQSLRADSTRAITAQQVAAFEASVKQAQFWEMSAEPPPSLVYGLGGAQWILEGVENGKYHIVDRWCPRQIPFGKLGQDLFDLAGADSRGVC